MSKAYNDFCKSKCVNPAHYDRMLALLPTYNTSVKSEEQATFILNTCIFGASQEGDYATGCVVAYKTPTGKIRLFLEPLIPLTPVPALPTHSTEK
jgi:hypothetical protein